MNVTTQKICAWGGPVLAVIWIGGFWILSGCMPPPSPTLSPEEIAAFYREDTDLIRLGILLTVTAGALLGPFFALISVHMRRIEGTRPVLAYAQLTLTALIIVEIVIPLSFIQLAAFRPNRSPELIQLLNDAGWLMFVGIVCTAVVQFAIIGIVMLQDTREVPIFPRWCGYYTLWTSLLVTPGSLVVFFKEGPFAWDGVFSWWIPVAVLALWFFVMTPVLLRAIGVPDADVPARGGEDADARIARLEAEVAALRGPTATR